MEGNGGRRVSFDRSWNAEASVRSKGGSAVLSVVPAPRVWEEESGDVAAISTHVLHVGAR